VPAAAVIPAPIAYIKVAAVKKLVVGLLGCLVFLVYRKVVLGHFWRPESFRRPQVPLTVEPDHMGFGTFTLKKLECSKPAMLRLNTLAWNNGIGLWSYFVGLRDRSND